MKVNLFLHVLIDSIVHFGIDAHVIMKFVILAEFGISDLAFEFLRISLVKFYNLFFGSFGLSILNFKQHSIPVRHNVVDYHFESGF